MNRKYGNIAHDLNMNYVRRIYPYVKNLVIERTFKDIKTKNIDSLKSIENKPKLILPYPHSSLSDTILIPYVLLTNDLHYPITAAGDNLPFRYILKKLGCFTFRRKSKINLEEVKYITYLLEEENRDVVFFSGFTEENGLIKAGRNWDGRLQKMSSLPISAAYQCYRNGTDVGIILVNLAYEPIIPEELMFQLLKEGEFPTKWYYKILKRLGFKSLVKYADYFNFMFPPKRELIAHVYFSQPYTFSQLYEKFSDSDKPVREITKFLEKTSHEHMIITPLDWYIAGIPKSDNRRVYENNEIKENMLELREKLYGKANTSLIDGDIDDIISKVKKTRLIVEINSDNTIVKNPFLLDYHRNRVLDLIKTHS